jgi:hypothetical protein
VCGGQHFIADPSPRGHIQKHLPPSTGISCVRGAQNELFVPPGHNWQDMPPPSGQIRNAGQIMEKFLPTNKMSTINLWDGIPRFIPSNSLSASSCDARMGRCQMYGP